MTVGAGASVAVLLADVVEVFVVLDLLVLVLVLVVWCLVLVVLCVVLVGLWDVLVGFGVGFLVVVLAGAGSSDSSVQAQLTESTPAPSGAKCVNRPFERSRPP